MRKLALAALVVAMLVGACGGDDDTSDEADANGDGASRPVVVDTDMSVEGAMAILYLLEHPDVRVEAITVAGTGLVSCEAGVAQAAGLVALADAGDVPVACGPTEPLDGDHAFPPEFRAAAGVLSGVELPEGAAPSELTAPEPLASVIASSDEPVAVYADGPLTNIALMLDDDPSVIDNITGVTAMGGALDVRGNVFDNPDAEWNIWVDPAAAAQVLEAGVPVTLVPLDATNEVPLTTLHVTELAKHRSTPIASTVSDLANGISDVEDGFVYFWDQLNAAVLVDESIVTIEERPVRILTAGGPDAIGATVEHSTGTPVRVAVDADREAFEAAFFTTLVGPAYQPVDLSGDIEVVFDGREWTADLPATLPLGPTVLRFVNESAQEAVAVVGWITGEATPEDLDAWDSVEQPPWFEVAGITGGGPNETYRSVFETTVEGQHVVVGLTFAPDSNTRIATVEVG